MISFLTIEEYIDLLPISVQEEIIGKEIIEALKKYNKLLNTNGFSTYSKMIINMLENQIFYNKKLFSTLITFLPENIITELSRKMNLGNNGIENRNILSQKSFGENDFSRLFLDTLSLSHEKYLNKLNSNDIFESSSIIKPYYSLHPYQSRIKDEVLNILLNPEEKDSKLLIHMPTGSGKTKTAMEIISDYIRTRSILGGFDNKYFIVWLAHTKELCDQAYKSFKETWIYRGDKEIKVLKLFGTDDISENDLNIDIAVIVAGFQKFNSILNSNKSDLIKLRTKIKSRTKLLLVDEAHKSLAMTYNKSISFLIDNPGTQLIGLTATPGRTGNIVAQDNNVLASFYNSKKILIKDEFYRTVSNPIKYLQEKNYLAEIDRKQIVTEIPIHLTSNQIIECENRGDFSNSIIHNFALNPIRNNIIINNIADSYHNNESTLVFACSIDHCYILKTILTSMHIPSEIVIGDTEKCERERIINDFRNRDLKILINYGVLTTGFDAPRLNTLIIARPVASIVLYSQMIGRALRGTKNGGNSKNKIIDLIDNFTVMGKETKTFAYFDEIWEN